MSGPQTDAVYSGAPAANPSPSLPWPTMAWTTLLLVVCYAPILWRLVNHWMQDEDMGHGFFVPVVAAYIAWQRREEILSLPREPNFWGAAILAFGALQECFATLGAELFLARTAFLISTAGAILLLAGTRVLRALAFPLFLLVFMVPIPAVIYNQITFPLQLLASQVAEFSLGALGIPVLRDGNVLELASQKLSVVEACSGIRSLLSLSFLSLVYAHFFDSKRWMRWALLAATVPIAIVANASRVTITGLLSEWNPEYASGTYHSFSGWVIFMVALVMLVMVHQTINRVYSLSHGKR